MKNGRIAEGSGRAAKICASVSAQNFQAVPTALYAKTQAVLLANAAKI